MGDSTGQAQRQTGSETANTKKQRKSPLHYRRVEDERQQRLVADLGARVRRHMLDERRTTRTDRSTISANHRQQQSTSKCIDRYTISNKERDAGSKTMMNEKQTHSKTEATEGTGGARAVRTESRERESGTHSKRASTRSTPARSADTSCGAGSWSSCRRWRRRPEQRAEQFLCTDTDRAVRRVSDADRSAKPI